MANGMPYKFPFCLEAIRIVRLLCATMYLKYSVGWLISLGNVSECRGRGGKKKIYVLFSFLYKLFFGVAYLVWMPWPVLIWNAAAADSLRTHDVIVPVDNIRLAYNQIVQIRLPIQSTWSVVNS